MGQYAARLSDQHVCPAATPLPHVGGPILPPCSQNVSIGGMRAARALVDMATCASSPPAIIVTGSGSVKINGLPAARMGDKTAHGGVIMTGFPTVSIGG
jgi:uncharacterized Zn-binding protein involved in type VI secretion